MVQLQMTKNKNLKHSPTLNTVLMIEEVLKEAGEVITLAELKRRLPKNMEINYWKNRQQDSEVDFVIREGLKAKEIIQVCYSINDEKTKSREIKGIINCSKELKSGKGLIITKDFEKHETIDGIKIKFIPLWKWLLEKG